MNNYTIKQLLLTPKKNISKLQGKGYNNSYSSLQTQILVNKTFSSITPTAKKDLCKLINNIKATESVESLKNYFLQCHATAANNKFNT